ncbi:MAG: hypothetical protein LQ346_003014 [Caloplaca aetnensis]|nr:MAG: hypothetical protein LQ346_003014 [Caloplaca aetnensis]
MPLPNGSSAGGMDTGSTDNARNADGTEDVPLPPWLTAPDAAAGESPSGDVLPSPISTEQVDAEKTMTASLVKNEARQRPLHSPVNELNQTVDIDEMRRIIGKIRVDRLPLRRKCSIIAFENLVRSGCETDRILEFLGDRTLNQRGARNLTFFVAYCLETSRVEEMRVLCRWVAQQLFVGRYSDSALLLVLQSLFNVRQRGEWQSVLRDYCEHVVRALGSSPVVHTEYLKLKTWSNFLGIMFDDVHSEGMLSAGVSLVKTSSSAQLDHLTERSWPLVEHWISSSESSTGDLVPETFVSKITVLLQALPQQKLCEVVAAVSWKVLEFPVSRDDYHGLRRRYSVWWSATRSPKVFQYLRESDLWSEIASELQRRHDEEIVASAVADIRKQLDEGNVGAAHSTMLQHPRISFDYCPDLAEALILSSERDAKTALEMLRGRRPTVSLEEQNLPGSKSLQQIHQNPIRLFERMATAYAQSSHIKPSFAFRCVYECWTLQKREGLGPVTPAMARSLVQTGIVRPLQSGRRLVSQSRLEWILLQVAEAEGEDVMREVGATVWQWREQVIQQMQHKRDTKRQCARGKQWQEQTTTRREAGHWDALKRMALAGEPSPSKLRTPPPKASSVVGQRAEPRPFQVDSRASMQRDISQRDVPPSHSSHLPVFSAEQDEPDKEEDDDDNDEDEDDDEFDDDGVELPWAFRRSDSSTSAAAVLSGLDPGEAGAMQPSPKPNTTIGSIRHAAAKRSPIHRVDDLLKQLNVAPPIHSGCVSSSLSEPSMGSLPELSPIPPCSLQAAVDVRRTIAEEAGKRFVIRRLIGIGQIHGAREGEEVTTLSTALQPAVGTGFGGLLAGGSGLEGFGTDAWEC